MSTTAFATITVTAPGQEPVVHDSALMDLDTIEAIALDSPHGTYVYTRRGVWECRRAGDAGIWLSHTPGAYNFALDYMIHVLSTESLPVI